MDSADTPDRQPAPTPEEDHRLTAEELAFLLRDPAERARDAERAARSNRNRTERRASDPDYAERLRAGDRERQRRRRMRDAIGRPEPQEVPAVPLPDLSEAQAAERLATHLDRSASAQAAQLRRQPDRIRLYAEAFVAYRTLSSAGARPTRGALATLLKSRFGRSLTPSQIQKLRDHVEGFAMPGGPWEAAAPPVRRRGAAKADMRRHASQAGKA
ncbi:hypothetical protein VY88_02835 [Azospirillum thiophilum]|uniref:Uncharacterized protein n=1 Tax=Azospirillum thiophilum TaxID=528244 RepID=A0AAC8VXN9_9PROT|nr:hypothetical protein [Azospirillum thiophilum]ALG71165.1 hypothetical protein AL072_09875 [Azospirillum thiophilum]KJR65180.1 hypothetical protein VY88_02835 [Azospirillum thiophilum]